MPKCEHPCLGTPLEASGGRLNVPLCDAKYDVLFRYSKEHL